jgi:hypothetical protein
MSVEIKKDYMEAIFMDLKIAICEKYEIPINFQRLILCGKLVLDNETLYEKNVFAETCIHLVILKNVEEKA